LKPGVRILSSLASLVIGLAGLLVTLVTGVGESTALQFLVVLVTAMGVAENFVGRINRNDFFVTGLIRLCIRVKLFGQPPIGVLNVSLSSRGQKF
jgi:hypothetical protein